MCDTCKDDYRESSDLIPVWEDPDDYERGEEPDYIGCLKCHTMTENEVDADSTLD